MHSRPLLETILKTSARIGKILVPATSLERYLGRFVEPLGIWNHDETYKVGLLGSATPVLHNSRSLLVSSKHQINGRAHEDIGVLMPDGSDFITSSGSRSFISGEHAQVSDAFDVAAFDFSDARRSKRGLIPNQFDYRSPPPDTENTNILCFIISGYPSSEQKYDLADDNHIGLAKRIVIAEPDGQPQDDALLRLQFSSELEFDPDGLSGGPAFVVQIVDREPTVFLAGIVLRAGKRYCYILKSGFLFEFLSGFD